ncbi:hypothetical protein HMPREF9078_01772 [Capnocytophaga sp. oral taxon 380 str. F0488]|nr:hypothetical protein HMPREF9078_01772 [Capnocytophaga sp. oral taxon 380 str. F0488]
MQKYKLIGKLANLELSKWGACIKKPNPRSPFPKGRGAIRKSDFLKRKHLIFSTIFLWFINKV